MNSRNKNILIGGLLAIVLIMAVGYAAFSTTLTINSTANITSSWNVAFDTTKTTDYVVTNGAGKTTNPKTSTTSNTDVTMAITANTATLTAKLYQPGDKVVYTLTIKNTGSIAATLGSPSLTGTNCTVSGLTCTTTSGNIKFTVTNPASSSLAATTGSTTMTVTAEYVNRAVTSATTESASLQVTLTATQA